METKDGVSFRINANEYYSVVTFLKDGHATGSILWDMKTHTMVMDVRYDTPRSVVVLAMDRAGMLQQ